MAEDRLDHKFSAVLNFNSAVTGIADTTGTVIRIEFIEWWLWRTCCPYMNKNVWRTFYLWFIIVYRLVFETLSVVTWYSGVLKLINKVVWLNELWEVVMISHFVTDYGVYLKLRHMREERLEPILCGQLNYDVVVARILSTTDVTICKTFVLVCLWRVCCAQIDMQGLPQQCTSIWHVQCLW